VGAAVGCLDARTASLRGGNKPLLWQRRRFRAGTRTELTLNLKLPSSPSLKDALPFLGCRGDVHGPIRGRTSCSEALDDAHARGRRAKKLPKHRAHSAAAQRRRAGRASAPAHVKESKPWARS
jgi:hypothetical protein